MNFKIILITTILFVNSCLSDDIIITWDKEKKVDKKIYEKAALEYLKKHSHHRYEEYKKKSSISTEKMLKLLDDIWASK